MIEEYSDDNAHSPYIKEAQLMNDTIEIESDDLIIMDYIRAIEIEKQLGIKSNIPLAIPGSELLIIE